MVSPRSLGIISVFKGEFKEIHLSAKTAQKKKQYLNVDRVIKIA